MRKMFLKKDLIAPNRFLVANVLILAVMGLLLARLWYLQIYRGDHYRRMSENNRTRFIEVPAPRGMVFDRHGEVVLGNRPYFDLVYIPQYVKDKEKTLELLSRLLHVPAAVFERRLKVGGGTPRFLPINLKRNLSLHEVATVQSNQIFLPGIDIAVAPRRDYKPETPSHMVGYLGEISGRSISKSNDEDPGNPYRPGDLIGKQGLERRWEKYLRGKRGSRLVQVDAFGRRTKSDIEGISLPEEPPVPGSDVVLTLDMELQRVAREAFQGKNGSVVVLNPQNGEILAMVSEPGYDPNMFQGVLSVEKYRSLLANPLAPFLDKTTGGEFIPGSVYKAVVAVAALEEKVVTPQTTFHCPGHYMLGGETFHCHHRPGHGKVDLNLALMKSCDVFFYHVGVELGVDRIAKYARMFGLGEKLGVLLNFERPGLIPTMAWKRQTFNAPWTAGETPPVSIGQGANLMTPVQMANLYATLGNGGRIWRPFLVKRVINHIGETILIQDPELIGELTEISSQSLNIVASGLRDVVMHKDGTGKAAAVDGVTVAGKTGSVQVVSLKKNLTDLDVSMKWREHAMFAAFSPVENPEIAIAVVSEHDKVGGGGKSAAPVAGKIIAAYWKLKAQRAATETLRNASKNEKTSKQNAGEKLEKERG